MGIGRVGFVSTLTASLVAGSLSAVAVCAPAAAAKNSATAVTPSVSTVTLSKSRHARARSRAVTLPSTAVVMAVKATRTCPSARVAVSVPGRVLARTHRAPVMVNAPRRAVKVSVSGRCRVAVTVTFTARDTQGEGQTHSVPPPTPPLRPDPAPLVVGPGARPVTDFGARGDGVSDDSQALQAAFDAGGVVVVPPGRVFVHSRVLHVRVPGTRVTGGGTLLASMPATSSVTVSADGAVVDHVRIDVAGTDRRWYAYEQMALRVTDACDVTVSDVTVTGSAAAGVYVGRACRFRLERVTVTQSKADGIHVTGASFDGSVVDAAVSGAGDDGVAVVSYASDSAPVSRVSVLRPRVSGQMWGRGISVVGGRDITVSDMFVSDSPGAGLYVACEQEWATFPVANVFVAGGTLLRSNTDRRIDHGAIMMYSSCPGAVNAQVRVSDVTVVDTANPWAQVQLRTTDGMFSSVTLARLTFRGGPPLAPYGAPRSGLVRTGWTVDGVAVPDVAS